MQSSSLLRTNRSYCHFGINIEVVLLPKPRMRLLVQQQLRADKDIAKQMLHPAVVQSEVPEQAELGPQQAFCRE